MSIITNQVKKSSRVKTAVSTPSKFKNFLELFKIYWGYIMTFVAAVTFVWTLGVTSEKNNVDKNYVKSEIIDIKNLQKHQSKKLDEIIDKISILEQNQSKVIDGQNKLRESYVLFLVNFNELKNNGLTTNQFINYMEGIQFSIPQINTKKDTMYNYNWVLPF